MKKLLLVFPFALLFAFGTAYAPINEAWTVERFGCGCPSIDGSWFNANHFNVIVWGCLGVAMVVLWYWLVARLFKHRSERWRDWVRLAGMCALSYVATRGYLTGVWF